MVVMQDVDCQAPIHAPSLLAFFAARAVPGVEAVDGTVYRRSVALAHGPGVLALELGEAPRWALERGDPRDEPEAARLAATLLDADADPAAVDGALAADPLLRELVARRARPARAGLRRPGRDRRPRGARPAGQRRRRAHAGGPAHRAPRRAAARARRRGHPPVPGPAGAGGARPRGAADAARPRPLARRDDRRARGRARPARPRRLPRRSPASARGPPTTSRCAAATATSCSRPTSASAAASPGSPTPPS